MKQEILPKLLKKTLESKLKNYMNTLKLGLMTLKQDKQVYKTRQVMRLVQILETKRNQNLRQAFVLIVTKSVLDKKYEPSIFDLSNINEFKSFKGNTLHSIRESVLEAIFKPKLTKSKIKAAERIHQLI